MSHASVTIDGGAISASTDNCHGQNCTSNACSCSNGYTGSNCQISPIQSPSPAASPSPSAPASISPSPSARTDDGGHGGSDNSLFGLLTLVAIPLVCGCGSAYAFWWYYRRDEGRPFEPSAVDLFEPTAPQMPPVAYSLSPTPAPVGHFRGSQ